MATALARHLDSGWGDKEHRKTGRGESRGKEPMRWREQNRNVQAAALYERFYPSSADMGGPH